MITLKDIVINNKIPALDPYVMIDTTVNSDNGDETLGQRIGQGDVLYPGYFYFLGSITESEQVLPYTLPVNESEYDKWKNDPIKESKSYFHRKPYYDSMPIGMVVKREDNSPDVSILNLKVIPRNHRQAILSKYFYFMGVQNKLITKFYSENLTESEKTFLDRVAATPQFLAVTKSNLETMIGCNIGFAIDKYNRSSIADARLLDWNALPYLFNMDISNRGMVFNEQIGGLSSIQNIFVDKC